MLKTGLLIQDHDPRPSVAAKVARAVAIYWRKYHTLPDTCAVHQSAMGAGVRSEWVRVVGKHNVLQGHFWVGMEENEHKKPAS